MRTFSLQEAIVLKDAANELPICFYQLVEQIVMRLIKKESTPGLDSRIQEGILLHS